MTNARNPRRVKKGGRKIEGAFAYLTHAVLDSDAYIGLSHPAKSMLMELARQYRGDDNGRLLLTEAHLAKRGWRSNDVIGRAKRELLDAGFIFQTVQGHRPNRASWYAVTWRPIDKLDGFDQGREAAFVPHAYRVLQNAGLTPRAGVAKPRTTPPDGVATRPTTPPDGAMRPISRSPPTPPDGDPLEMPSARPGCSAVRTRVPALAARAPDSEIAIDDGEVL